MGFFADQRIKNGQRASTREDKAPMPKDRLNLNIKPDYMKGGQATDNSINQASPVFNMDSDQKKRSKQFPR